METLFRDHGVDLAFFGHVHDYERNFPVFSEKVYLNDVRFGGVSFGGISCSATQDSQHFHAFDLYTQPRATVHVTTGGGRNKEVITRREAAKGGNKNPKPKRGR
ncbi:hypothetical protein N8152_00180 [bacterium]|jgi:hypothetical protein|nr:hypothetical protein [bacterium]|tara:strand:- start:935 stop:1246 length:312 start_codon:yes stop_codon:yes gene_type:complete